MLMEFYLLTTELFNKNYPGGNNHVKTEDAITGMRGNRM
jgi:hypothetical protein